MILLRGHTLQAKNWFRVERMPLNLEERNSTATITVGPDAPEININDWLKDDTEPGKGIIWRVKSVQNQVDTKTRTISIEHIIQSLKDQVIFGSVEPKNITGNNNSTTCTARQAITYALGKQSETIWQLGTLRDNPSNPYSFNGDTIFAALETVTSSIDGAQWEYDLTSLPFTLNIVRQPSGFQSEMRMRRNITTLNIQIDRTRMYTRHYPIGKNNLHISGDYVSKNERTWGVVAKVETDQSQDTEAKLRAWSLDRLIRHCEPLVTVTIGGIELSEDTGEALDHIVIGRNCRLPLPEYGTTMTERVTKMSWADKIKEPKKVTVTLANLVEDVASIVNSLSSSNSKGGRSSAKKNEEDHAWFVDTTTHVAMVAEAVAGPGSGEDWSRVASVVVDGEGIHQRVTRTEGEVVTMWSAIEVLEDRIVLEVANAKTDTYSKIEQTASSIRSEVNSSKSTLFSVIMQTATNIYTQVGNAKSGLYSKIEQTASSIRSEVNSSKSTLFSVIMQTATNIYTQVGNAKSGLYSKIEQTASSIRSEVNSSKSTLFSVIMQTATNIYTQVGNAKSGLYSHIEQTASGINQTVSKKVGKSEVISCINQTAETILIQASKIALSGTTKINDVFTVISNAVGVSVPLICSGNVDINSNKVLNLYTATFQGSNPVTLTALNLAGVIKSASVSGNTLTLTPFIGDAVTFSKATSLSGEWSSGHLEVTASPQNTKYHQYIISGDAEDVSSDSNSWYVPILAKSNPNSSSSTRTGHRVSVNATARYNAGKTQGYKNAANAMGWPATISGATTKSSVDITYPNTSGGTSTRTLTLTKDSGGAYVKLGSSLILRVS